MIDLSRRSAQLIGYERQGTAKVRVQYIGPAPLAGETGAQLASRSGPKPFDFGAVGDGATDDSTALNAFLAYAAANRSASYQMGGNYAIASGLTLDGRSDLYSLGVILFEMLSGTKPFSGNSAVEVMQQHVRGQRPPLPPECCGLEPLLEGLMARDLSARLPDAAAAAQALAAAAASLETGPAVALAETATDVSAAVA